MLDNYAIESMFDIGKVTTTERLQLRRNLIHRHRYRGVDVGGEVDLVIEDSGNKMYLFTDSLMVLSGTDVNGFERALKCFLEKYTVISGQCRRF